MRTLPLYPGLRNRLSRDGRSGAALPGGPVLLGKPILLGRAPTSLILTLVLSLVLSNLACAASADVPESRSESKLKGSSGRPPDDYSPGKRPAGILTASGARDENPSKAPARAPRIISADPFGVTSIYETAAPAVVGITCRRGERFTGTGTIIHPSGLVLTSTTVVPRDATDIRVFLKGGRSVEGKLILVREEKELSLIRIRAPSPSKGFSYIPLGNSRRVRGGELALTLGNAFQSIEDDDQVTLGQGLVSGLYEITSADGAFESKYEGPVIETSAPLNGGMDGGPLLDRNGRMIGLLSLAFSKNRWLGTAIPIDDLKPHLRSELGSFDDEDGNFAAYAGLELEEVEGSGVRVRRVQPGGPLARAGVLPGQWLRAACGKPLASLGDFRECFGKARPGDRLSIEVSEDKDGPARPIEIDLWGEF